jgi:hypothetical protein
MTGGLLIIIILVAILVSLIVALTVVSNRRKRDTWDTGAGERQGRFAGPYSTGRYNTGPERDDE